MTKKFQALQIKRQFISDKIIIGIDPAKKKHQAVIMDQHGLPVANSFTFGNHKQGYLKLLKKVTQHSAKSNDKNIIFAIETSCNLWCTLSCFLRGCGYDVLLVSPLTTKHTRLASTGQARLASVSRTGPSQPGMLSDPRKVLWFIE